MIRPLTFLQTRRVTTRLGARRAGAAPPHAPDRTLPQWVAASPVAASVAAPLYYHWATSGFDAVADSRAVGWMFLRAWRRVLYVEALLVDPEWQGCGVEESLLAFAEERARALHRCWLGMTRPVRLGAGGEPAVGLGFQCAHGRVMVRSAAPERPGTPAPGLELRRLYGRSAQDAQRRLAQLDVTAGCQPVDDDLLAFLAADPYEAPGRSWHAVFEGQPIAYLSTHTRAEGRVVYAAAPPEWWGSALVLDALRRVLQQSGGGASGQRRVLVRFASRGHHEAAREALAGQGFQEEPGLCRAFRPVAAEQQP